jgi:spore coat protein U-like protein
MECGAMQLGTERWKDAGALCALACFALGSIPASFAEPAPTTGEIHVQARIESGCRVVGQAQTSGVDFGELDFDAHPSLFRQPLTARARVASGELQLRCVGVTSVNLTIGAGLHALGSQRRLASGAGHVPYDLFTDEAGTLSLGIDVPRSVPISPSGALSVVDLPVYGKVMPATGGEYAPGTYQDHLQVTVTW